MDQHEDNIEALANEDIIQLQKHSWIRRNWDKTSFYTNHRSLQCRHLFHGGTIR